MRFPLISIKQTCPTLFFTDIIIFIMGDCVLEITKKSRLSALLCNNLEQAVLSQNSSCDIVAISPNSVEELKKFLKLINKPLMIRKEEHEVKLLTDLLKNLDRECIISYATVKTYKNIVPIAAKDGHYLVLKTPIDMNLAKELNILSVNEGLPPDKIIMNTDIGGLGYGYEYGYSMIEKINLEQNDEYLNFPILTDAALEAVKTKEGKINQKYSRLFELSAVSGAIAAGANIFTLNYPQNVEILKGLL